ncbi:MAG: GIY-YIG nuclease family protein [Pyruvatibacter sp.]
MAYFVYIMANKKNGTLYVGSTGDIVRRVHEHREKSIEGFTTRYDVARLVYYDVFDDYETARQRERRIKKWNRAWKVELIETANPAWRDLWNEIARP